MTPAAAGPTPRVRSGMRCPAPANDNAGHAPPAELPRAALLHFAEHGLSAVGAARTRAQEAFFAGDRAAYHHWLGICRTFDRRLARTIELGGPIGDRRGR